MNTYFSINMPAWKFARNTLVVSCAGLFPLLLLYIGLTPGFGALLLGSGPAFSRFFRQVVTNGLPVVFAVNYVSFFLFAVITAKQREGAVPARILLIDLPARVVIFVLLHGVIYFISADWFGSFGGDHWQALQVVGPTLVRSAFFENISGVYLYATLVSALPLYATVIDSSLERCSGRWAWLRGLAHRLPGKLGPILLALGLFGIFTLGLTGAAAVIMHLQSVWI
ncbi:hypothetical protein K3722_14895 [Leisingera caerulea]|uniref:Uncharacterized protein n=1 Tax=Leisingera caerulea TaxID=506591 RepID=A0ABY5WTZ3_LEICA|nr:hypothetical protein [Leisingera caerulea]UWQ57781.1 hypothetical protein K3722_14895 [Leisingera caerulea]